MTDRRVAYRVVSRCAKSAAARQLRSIDSGRLPRPDIEPIGVIPLHWLKPLIEGIAQQRLRELPVSPLSHWFDNPERANEFCALARLAGAADVSVVSVDYLLDVSTGKWVKA